MCQPLVGCHPIIVKLTDDPPSMVIGGMMVLPWHPKGLLTQSLDLFPPTGRLLRPSRLLVELDAGADTE